MQGNPHKVINWFFSRNSECQKGMAQYTWGEERKKKKKANYNQEYSAQQGSHSDLAEK